MGKLIKISGIIFWLIVGIFNSFPFNIKSVIIWLAILTLSISIYYIICLEKKINQGIRRR